MQNSYIPIKVKITLEINWNTKINPVRGCFRFSRKRGVSESCFRYSSCID